MTMTSLPQRALEAIEGSTAAERIARVQEAVYRPLIDIARRSPLHSRVLGHSLHPPLTDVVTGCWLSTSVLDLAGGAGSRRAAMLIAGVGVVAAVPTALAGAADWAETEGGDRRIGAVHAAGVDAAILLLTCSLVARARGAHGLGVGLALLGNAVVSGAGFLGGHLALQRGAADRG